MTIGNKKIKNKIKTTRADNNKVCPYFYERRKYEKQFFNLLRL